MRPFAFLTGFGAAIWAIGNGWTALLRTWAAPTWAGVGVVAGYLGVFVVTFLSLGFGIYASDRAAGRVRTRIALYEWVLARQHPGRREASPGRDPGIGAGGGDADGERRAVGEHQ